MTASATTAPVWVQALLALGHVAVLVGLSPLLLGVVVRVKAWFAGRKGPPLLQPYFELAKLLRKGAVVSQSTTWVFRLGPVAGVVTALVAGLFVPLGGAPSPFSFAGDLMLVAYLLALGRFATVLSALDTGSAFEGMGASREVAFSCLVEPALFLGWLALAQLLAVDAPLTLTNLLAIGGNAWAAHPGALLLVVGAWVLVVLAENCRIPFDDPNTHLELTMIHEVMVLDHSGPMLGLVEYGAALKLTVTSSLVLGLLLPSTGRPELDLGIAVVGLLVLAGLIGVVESVLARQRLLRVPMLLVTASLMAAFSVALVAMR
ncbi:MAG: respiratory chain complex I subunit 1 family protein [Myxococcota bacterium]